MAIKIPATWSSTAAYSVGDRAFYNGVIYQCIVAVAANPDGNADPVDNTSWKVFSVIRIQDYYSLQESIIEALNVDDDFIYSSIPLFIQSVEVQLSKLIQAPAQKVVRVYEIDTDGKFQIPADLLTITHLRHNGDSGGSWDIFSRGSEVIVSGEQSEFQMLRQQYRANNGWDYGPYEYPIYWTDDEYIWIAPLYPNNSEFELTYYQDVPSLGTTVGLVRIIDGMEFAINDSDQTLMEWEEAGNDPADFVQAMEVVTENLWVLMLPHLLKAGALVEANLYLRDYEAAERWKAKFTELLSETQVQIDSFNTDRDQGLYQRSAY